MTDCKQDICGGCGFLFFLCLTGKLWGKCHFGRFWLMLGFIQGHVLERSCTLKLSELLLWFPHLHVMFGPLTPVLTPPVLLKGKQMAAWQPQH